jgi:hypothetical protein
MTIGSKPGAATIPFEMIEVGCAGVASVDVEEVVVLATSRTGAPKSILPVANCSVYFFSIDFRYDASFPAGAVIS